MNGRTVVISAIAAGVIGTLYLYYYSPINFSMSSSKSDISPLEFKLSQISSKSPPSLLVTLRNTHPTKTFALLKWDTPLDPSALNLGIFKIEDADTGKAVDVPKLMLNRLMPPSRDALEEIAPGTEHSVEVVFDRPWMPTQKPARYKVSVEGQIRAVWEKKASYVQASELEELGGDDSVTVAFKSEPIEITVE